MRSVLTALCLFASTAHAVPAQFTHQGRLLDADGVPLEGEATIIFRVTNDEMGGDELWEEAIAVSLTNGFYSAVLGADDEGNPLDTDVLSQAPVWLELQLDGEPAMSPRSPIHAAPYATMATVAEEVSGGPVDASQIAVAGTPVVNEAGEWVGPAPTVNWSDIEGMPEDFSDGIDDDTDTDTDSFAALGISCLDGDIPVWDSVLIEWTCGIDAVLTADEVDAIVADNGYAMESEVFSSSFLDLTDVPDGLDDGDQDTLAATACENGQVVVHNLATGTWVCGNDTDTTLSSSEVRAMVEAVASLALQAGATVDGSAVLTESGHSDDASAHHSATSDGLHITPASVALSGSDTQLVDGQIDLGSEVDDALTSTMVQTLTGGGDADTLHTHAASSGGDSGRVGYLGVTSTPRAGDATLEVMENDCAAAYGEARMCRMSQIKNSYPAPRPASQSWMLMDTQNNPGAMPNGSEALFQEFGESFEGISSRGTVVGWFAGGFGTNCARNSIPGLFVTTDVSGSTRGYDTLRGVSLLPSGRIARVSCDNSFTVACCGPL